MAPTPSSDGFFQPAEWTPHSAVWLAWPSHADLWLEALEPVREAFLQFVRAITNPDPVSGVPRGEGIELLVGDAENEALARERLRGLPVRFHRIPFGDIWLRDTAPVFLKRRNGQTGEPDEIGGIACASFAFNGWGGKYVLPFDDQVSARVAEASAAASGTNVYRFPFVLEGGSVEVDGEGTCLTTRQCLLNPNRNPGLGSDVLEEHLRASLGVRTVLWLGDGLLNDHTDGHIDTVARFIAPGRVVCMVPASDDPNREVLETIRRDLASFRDARGRRLRVETIPSPGRVVDEGGKPMAASYVNFYIANTTVIIPRYGAPADSDALRRVGNLFPGRRAVGVPAKDLLAGGGALHCISQQQPA
ncbi:MAG TPA: agmatine deiminase family protein [Thermoanaerobaculia bacterium]